MTLPTFIRTGDTYFHEKLLHVNAMTTEFGLPSIFITLTMAESKWTHLTEILRSTDNGDTRPGNRPLHTALHFVHRKQELKRNVWCKPDISNWGEFCHFFERVEFQNRGAAHTHSCIWVSKNTQDMITDHTIRSDLPDADLEPELYRLVLQHQIHTCSPEKCRGPAPPGQTCKRGFPRPFSSSTHYNPRDFRYMYRCVNPADQWVVPYHAPTLFIWNAHMNAQYVTSRGLGKYLTKYVVKAEPSHVFNVSDGNTYREHIIARRLGSMECMFLLLGETICNSSIHVKYLPTDLPSRRLRAIRPISAITEEEDEDPYWKDHVEKYFARPEHGIFRDMTYPHYFKNYRQLPKPPSTNNTSIMANGRSQIYKDKLNNFIIKRTVPIVTRFRYLTIQDGESFFYQQLLLTLPCRNENDLLGGFSTYRAHFLHLHPELQPSLHEHLSTTINHHHLTPNNHFDQVMTNLMEDLATIIFPQIQHILRIQLNALKHLPPILPHSALLTLPEEQYNILNIITSNLGPLHKKKWPFFFITGSAGTGKSYLLNLIVNWLRATNKNYLLMAPTGVAAQSIGGLTIHSALRITQSEAGFQSLALYDQDFRKQLLKIKVLIIDEISMVSASLFTFLANMFAQIHNISICFGGISVIVVGDLAQLPPVRATPIFHSAVWQEFYPLFLHQSQHQQSDLQFFHMLQEIRLGNISQATWSKLLHKAANYQQIQSLDLLYQTTHIVGHCKSAEQINRTICNALPVDNDKFINCEAIDFQNGVHVPIEHSQTDFKTKTNLPTTVRLQQGARVMFLNNSLINEGICNGTIGIITDVDKSIPSVQVAFCVRNAIVHKSIVKQTSYFYVSGSHASRTQFPLQNAFALTAHKTQSLTLPSISLALDSQLFSPGQAYVAISRCPSWDHVHISSLHRDAFMVDPEVVHEYDRLQQIATRPLSIT